MTSVRIMFTGIINVVSTGKQRRIVVPDLMGHHGHRHLPVMVVDRPHRSAGLRSLFSSGDVETFLLDGLRTSVGEAGGEVRATPALNKYLLQVADGCPATHRQCGGFSDTGKTDHISLDMTLQSGLLDACWIDRDYQWFFSPSQKVGYLAEEICLEYETDRPFRIELERVAHSHEWKQERNEPDVESSAAWIEIDAEDEVEIRIANIPPESSFLPGERGKPITDPHVTLYYDWSSINVPSIARRPLTGMFQQGNGIRPDHEHRLNGLAPIPLLRPLAPGGMNCPPGGWGGYDGGG